MNKNMNPDSVKLFMDGRTLTVDPAYDPNYPTVFGKTTSRTKNQKPKMLYQYGLFKPVEFVRLKSNFWAANCFSSMTHAQCTVKKTDKGILVLFTIKAGAKQVGSKNAA